MTIYRCDKCKKEFETTKNLENVKIYTEHSSYYNYELCSKCREELTKFLKEDLVIYGARKEKKWRWFFER